MLDQPSEARSAPRPRPGLLVGAVLGCAIALGTLMARRLGYGLGGWTTVRCRRGHLFTSLWIPGFKLKSVDLGLARIQRCPVGRHWSLVTPVRASALNPRQLRRAARHRDLPIP